MFLSVNYERRLLRPLLIRAGLGYVPICNDVCDPIVTAPFTLELLLGGSGSYLDLGGGGVLVESGGALAAYATAIVGFRYQADEPGYLVRVAFTPVWLEKAVLPWGGIAFGYSF